MNLPPTTQNLTALRDTIAPAWVSEPSGRGTWSLLYSCAFTIGLSVYSAVHLNIPASHDHRWTIYLRQAKWTVVAILAPEIVLSMAFSQLHTAYRLRKSLNRYSREVQQREKALNVVVRHRYRYEFGETQSARPMLWPFGRRRSDPKDLEHDEPSAPLPKAQFYDIIYCFYVVMGGFVVDVSDMHNTYTEIVLTPEAIIELASRGHHFDIPSDSIKDRSKANLLAKGLVVCQISWLVIQSVARSLVGLPLSLLEVHAMVHVACAVCLYALWWWKPKDIQSATIVDAALCIDDVAELLMFNLENYYQRIERNTTLPKDAPVPPPVNPETFYEVFAEIDLIEVRSTDDTRSSLTSIPSIAGRSSLYLSQSYDYKRPIPPGSESKLIAFSGDMSFEVGGLGVKFQNSYTMRYELTDKDILRWRRASLNLKKLSASDCIDDKRLRKNYFRKRAKNYLGSSGGYIRAFAFVFLLALYGGVHFSVRNEHFPTRSELLIWLVSCYILLGAAALVFPITTSAQILRQICHDTDDGQPERILNPPVDFFFLCHWEADSVIIGCVSIMWACIFGLLYTFARLFLVIESFISLRSVPLGVYYTPNWTGYLPHF
ncbi:MAG: hypothetical protein M1822_008869 [Bathelium mastoideum]|nr:MAG: hypothetical protein M1822_008869 [Bathelium mastoideum]